MAIQTKNDARVIVPYSLAIAGLFIALYMRLCTWPQFMIGFGLLNFPAYLGLRDPSEPLPRVEMSDPPGSPDTPPTTLYIPPQSKPPRDES